MWLNPIHQSQEKSISLSGGKEKTVTANYQFLGGMASIELIDYYKFSPGKRFSPYLGIGTGYYLTTLNGYYSILQEIHTPLYHYDYKYLNQSFSGLGSNQGYVLAGGVDWILVKSVFDMRVDLEAKYHWIPKVKVEFDVNNEGFSSLPTEPEPFEIDPSGLSIKIWIGVRF